MPSRGLREKTRSHEVDIKGVAVALAFLLSISVFAGGRDDRSVNEDQPSPSVSMQISTPLSTDTGKTEALQTSDKEADFSDTSRRLEASRLNHASTPPSVTP